jgi:hypothetical protein
MKNNQQQILSEIKSLMASVKTQLEALENKIVEFEQYIDAQDVVDDLPVDELIEELVEDIAEAPVAESVTEVEDEVMDIELEPSDDLPFYDDLPQVSEPEPVAASDPEVEPVPDVEPISDVEPVLEVEALPEPVIEQVIEPVEVSVEVSVEEPVQAVEQVPVIDAMIAKQAWRKDMPGSPVKDIRSAISLNDRILFINYLFGEDPMAFQEMLTQLNAMSSFDEAAAHAIAAHPQWDLESDTVYRFMMALRRRHQ